MTKTMSNVLRESIVGKKFVDSDNREYVVEDLFEAYGTYRIQRRYTDNSFKHTPFLSFHIWDKLSEETPAQINNDFDVGGC